MESFENRDSRKQLLARSRYLLYKSSEKWTFSQKHRAHILFTEYSDLKNAYQLTDDLRKIYNQNLVRPGYHRIIERVLPFPGVLYTYSSFALNEDMPMPKIKCNLRITWTYARSY
ncbi:transposase [Elizabethkingia occulta]|uniref:transposase n=1 Tax=Elizabethkingia occulta TaxID=1867263 RepID=UPI0021CD9D50